MAEGVSSRLRLTLGGGQLRRIEAQKVGLATSTGLPSHETIHHRATRSLDQDGARKKRPSIGAEPAVHTT